MPKRIVENPEEFRANIRSKLAKQFNFNQEKHAINLEKGVHNWAIKEATNKKVVKKWDNPFFVQIYVDRLRSIYINLKYKKIIDDINEGNVKSQELAFMTHQEMRPDVWDAYIKAKSIRDMHKFEENIEAMTDTFTCRKCKQKRCSYYAMQTKSSDEPMTLFVQCLNCGARWKN
jgi:transcription elongation factor S-II